MAKGFREARVKRVGNLWQELTSIGNLMLAAKRAAAGKRVRPDVARFLLDLETEVFQIRRELLDETYRPGPYRSFEITDPKPRLISAAPFRDRVVHHALTQVLQAVFERRFSSDSFACRTGFGTHAALAKAKAAMRKYPYVLKCDVRKYFASIDHAILNELLARAVKCRPTLGLASLIIEGSNPQEEVISYYPGDDLFTPFERRRGLPLGNQTSQFFANVYLNPLDQFLNRHHQAFPYVRYVDDFLLFGDSKIELQCARREIVRVLGGLRLDIHPRKSRVYRTREGVTFLGWRLYPEKIRLVRANVVRFRRKLRELQCGMAEGRMGWDEVNQRIRAWIAHAAHGDTWRLREQVFGQFAFRKGSAV